MPANLCITPDLGKEDMDPEVSTRMIILSSKANVSESEVVNFLHMLNCLLQSNGLVMGL